MGDEVDLDYKLLQEDMSITITEERPPLFSEINFEENIKDDKENVFVRFGKKKKKKKKFIIFLFRAWNILNLIKK